MVELSNAELDRLADALAARLDAKRDRSAAPSPYMTIPEVAEYLRCTRQRVDDLLSAGQLSRHKAGRSTLVLRHEVERFVKQERP